MATIFEQIIAREKPSEIVFENERLLAIKDLYPIAPVHLLIITKKVIPSLQAVTAEDLPLMGEIVTVAQQLATEHGVADSYRLLTNVGPKSGQSIFHLHFHLIGGRHLQAMG